MKLISNSADSSLLTAGDTFSLNYSFTKLKKKKKKMASKGSRKLWLQNQHSVKMWFSLNKMVIKQNSQLGT